MPIVVNEDALRAVLQMPARPYSETFPYDSSSYFPLFNREVVRILAVTGVASGVSNTAFVNGVDFALNYGTIDWTVGTRKPDFGTPFTVDYTWSPLGSAAASVSLQNGVFDAQQKLGYDFPYGSTTSAGISTDALAGMVALFAAAREACGTMANSDIANADKYRRGAILIDDSKKTADWAAREQEYDTKFKRAVILTRPKGQVRAFAISSREVASLVFNNDALQNEIIDRTMFNSAFFGVDGGGIL